MDALDRLQAEQAFHDRQARVRTATFARQPGRLLLDDDAYLNHESWIRPAFAQLGDVSGLHALDYGCGHGMAAAILARRGAHVTAFDLSAGYLDEARKRACANTVAVDFIRANGEHLPFADASFDRIWGNAILHHLDMATAAREIRRVLRPAGIAVFCEPWGGNPLLSWARRRLHYPGKEHTADEQPLRRRHLDFFRQAFPALEVQGFQLLSMARRVLHARRVVAGLNWCDAMLLTRVPRLQQFCRYMVITLRR